MNDAAEPTRKPKELEKPASEILHERAELLAKQFERNEAEIAAAQRNIDRLERENGDIRDQQLRLGQASWLLYENKATLENRFAEVKAGMQ